MHQIDSLPLTRSWYQFLTVFVVCLMLTGSANAQQETETSAGGIGADSLDISDRLQVERTGVVGESSAPPAGASAASAAAQSSGANATGGRAGGLGGLGGGGGGLGAAFGNLFGSANSQSSRDSTPPIRTRLRSAVTLSSSVRVAPIVSGATATTRLRQSSTLQPGALRRGVVPGVVNSGRYDRVGVQIQERTAILTGQVRTEADRRMSHMMMRLEPGVSEVQNRIQLSPEP